MSQHFNLDQIRELVEQILATREKAEHQESVEPLLEKAAAAIKELTEALEAKSSTISEMESKLTESEAKNAELSAQLVTITKDMEEKTAVVVELTTKLEEARNTLVEIDKARVADSRMLKLEEAKVARVGDDRQAQYTKIREMSDEKFDEYLAELVSIRAALVEELKKVETPTTEEPTDTKPVEEKKEDAALEVPPAEIKKEDAVDAALNLEVTLNTAKEKWDSFSKAFSELVNKR